MTIDPNGGLYLGTTAGGGSDFTAGCDLGGAGAKNAPDRILRLDLPAKTRVVLDTQGSSFNTILNMRTGQTCPGSEVSRGCSVGFDAPRSFLDLTLAAGTYWIQIDGYDGQSGVWVLDIFTTPL